MATFLPFISVKIELSLDFANRRFSLWDIMCTYAGTGTKVFFLNECFVEINWLFQMSLEVVLKLISAKSYRDDTKRYF